MMNNYEMILKTISTRIRRELKSRYFWKILVMDGYDILLSTEKITRMEDSEFIYFIHHTQNAY